MHSCCCFLLLLQHHQDIVVVVTPYSYLTNYASVTKISFTSVTTTCYHICFTWFLILVQCRTVTFFLILQKFLTFFRPGRRFLFLSLALLHLAPYRLTCWPSYSCTWNHLASLKLGHLSCTQCRRRLCVSLFLLSAIILYWVVPAPPRLFCILMSIYISRRC